MKKSYYFTEQQQQQQQQKSHPAKVSNLSRSNAPLTDQAQSQNDPEHCQLDPCFNS